MVDRDKADWFDIPTLRKNQIFNCVWRGRSTRDSLAGAVSDYVLQGSC